MVRRFVLSALAALMVVTSAAFAVARGQGSPAGWAELCSGAGVVMVALDANGDPAGPAHICPDAILFVAEAVPHALPCRPETAARGLDPAEAVCEAGQAPPSPAARGPPARA